MSSPKQKPAGKSMGQAMLLAGFTIALVGLTFYFDDWIGDQANPNESPDYSVNQDGVREVVLERNRQGHYVSSGQINGVPVIFLLDTGATDVAIPAEIARRAGLKSGYATQASTANGVVTVYSTEIEELTLGNIILHDVPASLTPSLQGNIILLGMSALQQVEFIQRGSTLTLRQLPEA